MLCLNVARNGKPVCLVGAEKAESLQVSVIANPGSDVSPILLTFGETKETAEHRVSLQWLDEPLMLAIGDKVSVELMDSATPDPGLTVSERGRKVSSAGVELFCSWCGKSEHTVGKLIAGPGVYICDKCVELCAGIMQEGKSAR